MFLTLDHKLSYSLICFLFLMLLPPQRLTLTDTLFPYTTLCRSLPRSGREPEYRLPFAVSAARERHRSPVPSSGTPKPGPGEFPYKNGPPQGRGRASSVPARPIARPALCCPGKSIRPLRTDRPRWRRSPTGAQIGRAHV